MHPPYRAEELLRLDPPTLAQILKQHLREAAKLADILAARINAEAEQRALGTHLDPPPDPPRDPLDR